MVGVDLKGDERMGQLRWGGFPACAMQEILFFARRLLGGRVARCNDSIVFEPSRQTEGPVTAWTEPNQNPEHN